MSSVDINSIDDEDVLYKMLSGVEDFEQRKQIRARMRVVREARASAIARQKEERESTQEDAITMRLRQAEAAKQRKMAEYQERAKEGKKDSGIVEKSIREKHAQAEVDRAKKLQDMTEMGKVMSQVYHKGTDILQKAEEDQQKRVGNLQGAETTTTVTTEKKAGGATTTVQTVTTQKTKDGERTTVMTKQVSGQGGTTYGRGAQPKSGARGARAAFQQMDKTTAPPGGVKPNIGGGGGGGGGRGGKVAVQRSPSAIKQMLLDWCKAMTREYQPTVNITNFSGSWADGLAFCALIHHFCPNAFNFDELTPKNRRHNFTLAFDTAEKEADIAPLLDVEDMVRMKNPDWKCVFCQVQGYYRRFREESAPKKKPAEE